MDMESTGEFMGYSSDHAQIVRGKRTKRQRPSSPFGQALTSGSSSGGGRGGQGTVGNIYFSLQSPATSSEMSASTEEEEDMANCLIMLAQSVCPIKQREADQKPNYHKIEKLSSCQRFTEVAAATTTGKAGFYVYECKTCNRTFPSFQALGGHRASHKKPKAMVDHEEVQKEEEEEGRKFNKISLINAPPLNSLEIANNKGKVHECSICGSEFLSGQALGGHMRRHRTNPPPPPPPTPNSSSAQITTNINTADIIEKPRSMLSLDLNLPAPEDDHHQDSKFQFVFSAQALVDCRY